MKLFIALCAFLTLNTFAAESTDIVDNSNNGFFEQSELVSVDAPVRWINFRVNPVNMALGAWNADVDFAVADWLTVGPTFTYYLGSRSQVTSVNGLITTDEKSKFGAYNFGVRANLYFDHSRLTDGWILAPYVGIAPGTSTFTRNGKEFEGKFTGFIAGIVFSRQWVWTSGLNLTLGAGFAYVGLPQTTTVTSKNGDGDTATASVMETMPFRRGNFLPSFDVTLGFAL